MEDLRTALLDLGFDDLGFLGIPFMSKKFVTSVFLQEHLDWVVASGSWQSLCAVT